MLMLLLGSAPEYLEHRTGPGHPERPERLGAVAAGLSAARLGDAVVSLAPRAATVDELARVHTRTYISALAQFIDGGGGHLDPDTVASAGSWDAALLAAGSGLAAVEAVDAGVGGPAFLAVRPPGHHAVPDRAMGFCLFNNVAVTAAALVERGERVLIVDWDAHHGNGTQDMFWTEPAVLYVSFHQSPLYPGTGALEEIGAGAGRGTNVNFPMPPGATGDVYRMAWDEVVAPRVASFAPTWTLVSCGYDAHRDDPLTMLGLSAGDYADFTEAVLGLAPAPERLVVFLEGGYDLEALERSTTATVSALVPEVETLRPEPPSAGGPGRTVVERARDFWAGL